MSINSRISENCLLGLIHLSKINICNIYWWLTMFWLVEHCVPLHFILPESLSKLPSHHRILVTKIVQTQFTPNPRPNFVNSTVKFSGPTNEKKITKWVKRMKVIQLRWSLTLQLGFGEGRRTRAEAVALQLPFASSIGIGIAIATLVSRPAPTARNHGGEDEDPEGWGRHSRVHYQSPQETARLVSHACFPFLCCFSNASPLSYPH